MGLDGFRLDAVPYLFERDGTNGENLPETHQWLKRLRHRVDETFPGRVLVAEANQPPIEVVDYFGDADECHMAFHFPLMPRLFKALRDHQAATVADVLAETPAIPKGCQWGIFLRNHDELTLEMVTDEERDVLYRAYAPEPGMRRNVGHRPASVPAARRRSSSGRAAALAPAVAAREPRSSTTATRSGWGSASSSATVIPSGPRCSGTARSNGGFSAAPAERLYLPSIEDGEYGFHQRNVAIQRDDPVVVPVLACATCSPCRRDHDGVRRSAVVTRRWTGHESVLRLSSGRRADDQVLCVANFSAEPDEAGIETPSGAGRALSRARTARRWTGVG